MASFGVELSPPQLPTPPAVGAGSNASPLNYSEQLKGMTSQEVQDEVKWQEWKIEKAIGKVNQSDLTRGGTRIKKMSF